MPSVVIIIEVVGQAPGVPGESRLFAYDVVSPTPPLVTVELYDDTDVDEYFWEFLDAPIGSTAVFSDPTSSAPTFTPDADLAGTYIIQCTVNDGESRGKIGLAFGTERLDVRKLAAGEGPEFDEDQGWVQAYNDFIDKVEALIIGGNVIGPDPSTLRAIATYANTSGSALYDNFLRIEVGQKWGNLSYRSIQAIDDEGSPSWLDLIGLDEEPANGSPGGYRVVVGNSGTELYLITAGEAKISSVGGIGYAIHTKISIPWRIDREGGIQSQSAHTVKAFYIGSTGASNGQVDMYVGAVNPNSVVTALPGSVYWRINGVSSAIYQHRGASSSNSDWVEVVGGGGGDFVGPASSYQDGIVIFGNTSGKLGASSPMRIQDDVNGHSLQILDHATGLSWDGALNVYDVSGSSTFPNGDTLIVGSPDRHFLIQVSDNDPWVQRTNKGDGRMIYERVDSGWKIRNPGILASQSADTTAVNTLKSEGTNGAESKGFIGNRDPVGSVTGSPGDTYTRVDGVQSNKYLHRGVSANNTDWYNFSLIGGTALGETWAFNTATSGDPGSKKYLLNNATQSSATAIHVSDTADNGVDFSSVLLKLTTNDSIYIQQSDDPSRYMLMTVTGPAVDQTTYVQIPISVQSSGTAFTSNKKCPARCLFSRTGAGSGTTANVGFYAYRTGGNITLGGSGVGLEVGLDSERDDAGGDFVGSSTTNLFTAPTAGRYVFTASGEITINHTSGGVARLYLYSSAHGVVAESQCYTDVGGKTLKPCVAAVVYMDASETMQLFASQESADNAVLEQQYLNFTGAQIVAV